MPPTLLALGLALGLLALGPARRLHLAGWSRGTVTAWYGAALVLSILVVYAPGGLRLLVPVLVALWLLPFLPVGPFRRRRPAEREASATPADREETAS